MNIKTKNSSFIASVIIGGSIILAALLYYEANRYEYSSGRIIDKYHGTYQMATVNK